MCKKRNFHSSNFKSCWRIGENFMIIETVKPLKVTGSISVNTLSRIPELKKYLKIYFELFVLLTYK